MTTYETIDELLNAWDKNELISTIEMGGIGPGYEQAIQVAAMETIREIHNSESMSSKLKSVIGSEHSSIDELNNIFDKALDSAIDRHGECLHGLTGAQAGAAKHIAYKYISDGHRSVLDKAREQGLSDDRFIFVCKHFNAESAD